MNIYLTPLRSYGCVIIGAHLFIEKRSTVHFDEFIVLRLVKY